MKRKNWIPVGVALVVAWLGLCRVEPGKRQSGDTALSVPLVLDSQAGEITNTPPPPAPSVGTTPEEGVDRKKAAIYLDQMRKREVGITFYGRVVDENNRGIPDATVKAILVYFDPLRVTHLFCGTKTITAQTDADGNAVIRDIMGYSLAVTVGKGGYEASIKNPFVFDYARAPADTLPLDSLHPALFQMRKRQAGEPLISRFENFTLPKDGVPVLIDVLNAKTNSDVADLKVQCWTDAIHQDANGRRRDWHARIEFLNGGFLESPEEFDYTAPDSGYQPVYEVSVSAQSGLRRTDQVTQKVILRLRNGGLYARGELTLGVGARQKLYLNLWLNPSGSKNLESNPAHVFTDANSYSRYMDTRQQGVK